MVVKPTAGEARKVTSSAFKDKSKPKDIRTSNITAAKGTGTHDFVNLIFDVTISH